MVGMAGGGGVTGTVRMAGESAVGGKGRRGGVLPTFNNSREAHTFTPAIR